MGFEKIWLSNGYWFVSCTLHNIVSNAKIDVNDELARMWKEAVVVSSNCLIRLRSASAENQTLD
jgi:hypothetical protein